MRHLLITNGIVTRILAGVVLLLPVNTTVVWAACDQGDAPDCACFDDTPIGVWDAGGSIASGPIQDVAQDTVGTKESCNTGIDGDTLKKDSGKPYYSIVLGYNSESKALDAAAMMADGIGSFESRQPWCSETISYWHREAGIPYPHGYAYPGHPNWLIKSVPDLRTWYEAEEGRGRGRWVEATEVDYNDFRPGVNAPLPGAYMAWTGCVRNVNTGYVGYYAFEVSHSLLIDEMWVHRDGSGRVFQVGVTFLEGNSSNQVKNSRRWDDLIVFTPQGSQWIGWNKGGDKIANTIDDIGLKIYGFGIDLDADGNPIYDESRLHYVDHPYIARTVHVDLPIARDDEWHVTYAPRIPALKAMASRLRKNQGPELTCSSKQIKCAGLPDGYDSAWRFPKGIKEEVSIEVDFLAPNPLPLEGVRMFWDPAYLPQSFKVQVGDTNRKFNETTLTGVSKYTPSKDSGPVPMVAKLSKPMTGMRYIKFTFPKGIFANDGAQLGNLELLYEEGKWGDADEIPEDVPIFVDIMPGRCPNILPIKGEMQVALLGSETMAVDEIETDSLRFNGSYLKPLAVDSKDVSTPFIGSAPGCHTLGPDGHKDLVLSYDLAEFTKKLAPKRLDAGQHVAVKVTGQISKNNGNATVLGQDFLQNLPDYPQAGN